MNYPKPTALRIMEGSRLTNDSEPKPVIPSDLSAPEYYHLSPEEEAHWDRTAQQLHAIGVLTLADYDSMADYVRDMAWADRLRDRIKTEGETIKITNRGGGESSIRNQAVTSLEEVSKRLSRFRNEFGMNAVSRTRVRVDVKQREQEEDLLSFVDSRKKAG